MDIKELRLLLKLEGIDLSDYSDDDLDASDMAMDLDFED